MATYELPRPPRRILCIGVPGFGDALLTTPLIRSLKRAWPEAAVDVVVHRGREVMLAGNPDVRKVVAVPKKPGPISFFTMFGRVAGRYDLGICPMGNDRNFALFRLAARRMVSYLGKQRGWKQFLANDYIQMDWTVHTVGHMLAFADLLGIERCYEVVPPQDPQARDLSPDEPFAVIHPTTRGTRKRWTDDGWGAVGEALRARGLLPVMTAGPGDERPYLDRVRARLGPDTLDLSGQLSMPELCTLLGRAALFVGVDTSASHLAGAVGTPTVTLFGPGSSVIWAPWPKGYDRDTRPFAGRPGIEQVENVAVVQADCECGLKYKHGCGVTMKGRARCLEELGPDLVIQAMERMFP